MKNKQDDFLQAWSTINPWFIETTKVNEKTADEIRENHVAVFTLQFTAIFVLSFIVPIFWTWSLWWKVALSLFTFAILLTKLYHSQYHVYDKRCCPSCKDSGFKRSFTRTIKQTSKGLKVKEIHHGYFPCDDQYHTYTQQVPFVLLNENIQHMIMDFQLNPSSPGAFINTARGNDGTR